MLKAVIFDFGGVLCLHPDEIRLARAAEAARLPGPQFLDAFWSHRVPYDAGELEPEPYWRLVTGDSYDAARLTDMIQAEIGLWDQYDARVFAWIGQLKAAGLQIGILSNLPRVLGEALLAEPGFLDPFDHRTFSYEVGSVKPQAAIYEHAFQGLGVAPGEALFLDDRPANVDGALAAGLRAELFPSWEDFLASGAMERYSLPVPA